MSELVQDVRFAVRMLRRGWGVTLIAIGSLAVAIGGNTAVFGLINSLLFQPQSIFEPERVVVVQERRTEQPAVLSTLTTSLPTHADLATRSRTTTGWAAMRPTVLGLRNGDTSEPVSSAEVTSAFFEVAGVHVQRGREFLPEEGVPGGRPVAVVTPEFWDRTRGGGDPVGEIVVLDGRPVEIVGVLQESFSFLFSAADVWVPLTDTPTGSPRDRRDVVSFARLAPEATTEQAAAEIARIAGELALDFPDVQRDWTVDVFNAHDDIPDSRTKIFYGLLQGSVFFVLLIACANITNLLLARGQERRGEIALRRVLGAGRGRLARQLLTESSVMVGAGSVLGLALGWLGIRLLAFQFAGLLPSNYTPSLDVTVVLFTACISALAGLIFGLAPIVQTLKGRHAEMLREGGGKTSAGRARTSVTRGLVVAEIALSLVALGGGGMLVRSFLELQGADPGFERGALLTARLRVPDSRYPDDAQREVFLGQVVERVSNLDGVLAVGLINALPAGFQVPTDTFRIEGREADPAAVPPRVFSLRASPGYVDAIGISVLQGRFFDDGDRSGRAQVAVVNRSFAAAWFEGSPVVGAFVHFAGAQRQIVGVVEDVQQVLVKTPGQVESEAIYVPAAQSPGGAYSVIASTEGEPEDLKEPMRTELQSLDPDLTLSRLLTMDEVMEQFFAGIQVFNTILGGFGFLAMLLASLGTYGVLAYQVAQRRHEIGIRMAMGAPSSVVMRLVARQGIAMAAIGLALGAILLVPLTRLLRTLLDGFSSVSADTAVVVAVVLFLVTLAASLIPAYRAAGLDPVRALRSE